MSCIIVLGCFRSGTSAVAGVLHHLGIFMGNQFDDPSKNNIKGFWEDLEFKNLHKKIENNINVDLEYSQLINKRNLEHKLWGVKDPLLCKHLNFFCKYQKENRMIVCRRSVDEIRDSMIKCIVQEQNPSDRIKMMIDSFVNRHIDHMERSISDFKGDVLEIHKPNNMIDILKPICNFVDIEHNQNCINFLS